MDGLIIFLQIVLINLLLSGDNAIIIAMTSNQLPKEQRNTAIWWGTIAAVVLRCLLVIIALPLLHIPYIQAAGGLILLYIAMKLLVDMQHNEQSQHISKRLTMLGAIWTILAADFVMSLDNVLAISAIAKGDMILIMLGIAISIPMIVWGSKLFDQLLKRFSFLSFVGAGCLAFAGGEMIVKDEAIYNLILYKVSEHIELIPLLCVPLVIFLSVLSLKNVKP